MPESFEDQFSRVEGMASGDPTWDLSPNDQAALKALLCAFNRQARHIAELVEKRLATRNEVASVLTLMD